MPLGVALGVVDGDAPALRVGAAVLDGEGAADELLGVGLLEGLESTNCTGITAVAGTFGPAAPVTVTTR